VSGPVHLMRRHRNRLLKAASGHYRGSSETLSSDEEKIFQFSIDARGSDHSLFAVPSGLLTQRNSALSSAPSSSRLTCSVSFRLRRVAPAEGRSHNLSEAVGFLATVESLK